MNIKEALSILHREDSKFNHYPEDLNMLYMVKLSNRGYHYILHHNALMSVMYLSISDMDKKTSIYFSFSNGEIHISQDNERYLLPDSTASADEWFNFNIQCSGISKDDLYPELNSIEDLIFKEYKRVLMETLEYRGL